MNKIDIKTVISIVIGLMVLVLGIRIMNILFRSGKKKGQEVRDMINERISDPDAIATDRNKEMLDMKVVQIMAEFNQFPVSAKDLAVILTGLTAKDLEYVYKKFGIQERRPFGVGRQQLDLFGFFDALLWNKAPMKAIWIYEPYVYK